MTERERFEELYGRHSHEVYARVLNADTACDVTQETFLRLLKQPDNAESVSDGV